MAEATRDTNHKTVGIGVSSVDFVTPLQLRVNPSTNYLLVQISSDTITPVSLSQNKRDQNFIPTVYGVSNDDGTTLIPIRTDTDGKLLVQFT